MYKEQKKRQTMQDQLALDNMQWMKKLQGMNLLWKYEDKRATLLSDNPDLASSFANRSKEVAKALGIEMPEGWAKELDPKQIKEYKKTAFVKHYNDNLKSVKTAENAQMLKLMLDSAKRNNVIDDLEFKAMSGDINNVVKLITEEKKKETAAKPPTENDLLGKLQSLTKTRAKYEMGMSDAGYPIPDNERTKKGMQMIDQEIQKTSALIKQLYPEMWKKYQAQKKVVATGTYNGKKVVKYDDGSVEYAD